MKKILQNIIEKNKNKKLNDILNNKDNKIKEIYEEKNNLIKEEINKTLNGQNNLITNEIVKLSQEIETIKEYINSIKTLLINRTNDLGNIIKFTTQNEDNNNILEDIIFNAFNQPKIFIRSRMKPTKTIQAKKADLKKINKKINSNIRAKSLEKKFNSTTEHLPTINMIKDSGGVVFRERVFGTLMLTRSFGDKEMKKYGVLSTPDIFIKNVEKEDLFVVIASDGVWDVVEEDEIFKMAQENISSNDFSKKIINLAKERDTHDNISCIVIKLNKNN